MKTLLQKTLNAATDLLFPPRCVHCSAGGSLFCKSCVEDSPLLPDSATCRRCALPAPGDTCETCFTNPPALDRAMAVFAFDSAIRDAVTAFKYNDIRSLAPVLGTFMADRLPARAAQDLDFVVPVPMAPARLRSRGYNQSELLARTICAITGLQIGSDIVFRSSGLAPQARATSLEQRAENVKNAFTVNRDLSGLRILLIDDVMTTGSTLNSCAGALKQAGAAWAGALVLAREL